MVRESVKRLSNEEQQIWIDLDQTETLFYSLKTKQAKNSINKIRYLLIIRLHEIREGHF